MYFVISLYFQKGNCERQDNYLSVLLRVFIVWMRIDCSEKHRRSLIRAIQSRGRGSRGLFLESVSVDLFFVGDLVVDKAAQDGTFYGRALRSISEGRNHIFHLSEHGPSWVTNTISVFQSVSTRVLRVCSSPRVSLHNIVTYPQTLSLLSSHL